MDLGFDAYIKKIDKILRLIGMSINIQDSARTVLQRVKHHWLCTVHLIVFNLSIVGQIVWLVMGILNGESLLEITYLLPCVTMCMLGDIKICSFIYYVQHVNDVIFRLRSLEISKWSGEQIAGDNFRKNWLKSLQNVFNLLLLLTATGVTAFALGPFVIMASYYYTTGKVKLFLPFILWYPFDQFQLRTWPFVYIQQLWAAWIAVLSVYGTDCFFFTCCSFLHIQFVYLQRDIKQIVENKSTRSENNGSVDTFKTIFVQLVNRHRELIRCVELLNTVYCKSTLFNVVTSSVIICAAGFNLLAISNYVLMAPFCSFLIFGTLQVFFYCYYGDYVARSSIEVGDAIYYSRWYEVTVTERKYLYTVLMRSQKPCKFTAYLFPDINLRAFTQILSTSWSYFALLNQMYQK